MMTWTKAVSALLVVALLGGPLASVAGAQQPAPQPPAPLQAPSAQPPAPDLFQESLKAERSTSGASSAYDAEAIATNVFLVPGRAITCLIAGAVGVAVLAATVGTQYKAAAAVWDEGCGGRWTVKGDDMRPDGVSGRPIDYTQEMR
jgi:hypothetical protein